MPVLMFNRELQVNVNQSYTFKYKYYLLIKQKILGSFFLPRDQQGNNPSKNTDYEGLAYLGEYPLAWSACCANEGVYNLLLDNNADPDAQDTFGMLVAVVCRSRIRTIYTTIWFLLFFF